MKDVAKSILIHIVVGVILFAASLLFFNFYFANEKGQDYSEMMNATYPVMMVRTEQGSYNSMSAYLDPVDLSLVRNQITVVGRDAKLEICLHNYSYDITAVQYQLFAKSEDNVIEEGTLNKLEDNPEDNTRTGTISFETNFEKGKNYYLKMAVRLNSSIRVFFYTKIQNGEGCHLDECMDFATKFHNNLFDKKAFQDNITYLEPSPENRINSFEVVDIHSPVNAVSFGEMKITQESEPIFTVKEINDVYVVLQLDSVFSSEVKSGIVQFYDVKENYKLRYTSDRMYLLDYKRTMDAYYNKALNNPSKNYITLGIQSAANVDYISSNEGYKVCFTQAGQLWYYNYKSSDVAKVFSFSSESLGDLRNNQNEHGIKILQMDDDGNIIYLAYGYMNRGHYEGKNGIQLLRYDAAEKCNEEIAFFSTSIPYDKMRQDVEKLAYLSTKNVFYCLLDGDLHAIDLNERKDSILYEGMVNENITASKNQSIIAVEENQNLVNNTRIQMIDLESGQEQIFTCEDKERIRSVGFIANDFIYGIASASNVKKTGGNVLRFPMDRLTIVNIDGQEIKKYKKSGRYILDTDINGSVLEMKFGKKSGNKIVDTSDKDYIRYKEEEKTSDVSLVNDYSNIYWNCLSIRFPNYVYIQIEPDLVSTRFLSSEDNMVIPLERSNASVTQYYVYAEGQEKGVFDNLMQAISLADELRGSVIDSEEKQMWECAFASYAMVAGMDQVTKVKSDARSLAACLQMIAKVNGKQVDIKQIETDKKNIRKLVEQYSGHKAYNLSGCSTDEILYYVSKGCPVLAKYNKNRYVILMSYNSSKIRYLDPVTGRSTAVDRSSLTSSLENAGNKFYTYLEE